MQGDVGDELDRLRAELDGDIDIGGPRLAVTTANVDDGGMSDRRGQSRRSSSGGTTYVALLRGINVGKARQVSMSDLREILESLGYTSVQTLLRSGNVVFSAPGTDRRSLAGTIERALEDGLGMDVGVVVRTADELGAVMAANPMPEAAASGSHLHVMFLAEPLSAEAHAAIEAAAYPPDEVRCADREIYVWYRKGMSGSRTAELLGRQLRTAGTITDRNWNTVGKLLAMTRDP